MKVLLAFLSVIVWISAPFTIATAQSHILERRIATAANYLESVVKDSGRFVYNRDLAGNEVDSPRYNFLRHAGTVYAMALYEQSAQSLRPSKNTRKAAQYLIDCCLDTIAGHPDMLALWSRPSLNGKPHTPLQAKLGGTGLGLVALTQVEDVFPGTIEVEMLREMGNFLLFMQNYDGSFVSKYYPDSTTPKDSTWQSLYYPGEAALGLIMLYEIDSDRRWLEAAVDSLRYLARKRENQTHVEADHWALIATKRLFQQQPEALHNASPGTIPWSGAPGKLSIKDGLVSHAEKIVTSILTEQIQNREKHCLYGGFKLDGRIAPTATRLEGLLAAHSILSPGETREKLVESITLGIGFLARNQITEGPNKGGFARYSLSCQTADDKINKIRIDYVQHALAAFISYKEWKKSHAPSTTLPHM